MLRLLYRLQMGLVSADSSSVICRLSSSEIVVVEAQTPLLAMLVSRWRLDASFAVEGSQ